MRFLFNWYDILKSVKVKREKYIIKINSSFSQFQLSECHQRSTEAGPCHGAVPRLAGGGVQDLKGGTTSQGENTPDLGGIILDPGCVEATPAPDQDPDITQE